MTRIRTIYRLTICIVVFCMVNCDNLWAFSKDSIHVLFKEANRYCDAGNYLLAEDKMGKAIQGYATQTHSRDTLLVRMRIDYGWYKTLLGKYTEAEQIFKENDCLLEDSLYALRSDNFMKLSSLYGMQRLYDSCKVYTTRALEYAYLAQDTALVFHARSNLGDLYLYTGDYEQALAEYYEVRRLSVLLHRHEAISLGNLAIVHHKLGKDDIAEQYYKESLALSKRDSKVVYNIIFSEYCRFLIDKGRKIEARNRLHEAIRDGGEGLFGEYNKTFLKLLYETSDAYRPVLGWGLFGFLGVIAGLVIWVIILKKRNRKLMADQNVQEPELSSVEEEKDDKSIEHLTAFIGLTESYPQICKAMQSIRRCAGNRQEVMEEMKELEALLQPLDQKAVDRQLDSSLEKNNDFVRRLKRKHPDLSVSEIKLCLLILQGMNTKEIAQLTHRSTRGVESAKFRMRRKLSLDAQENLYDYLLKLED